MDTRVTGTVFIELEISKGRNKIVVDIVPPKLAAWHIYRLYFCLISELVDSYEDLIVEPTNTTWTAAKLKMNVSTLVSHCCVLLGVDLTPKSPRKFR
jgi:hypothetical protein